MLNKELSQFSDSSKSGHQISKYIMTFLDKEPDLDTGPDPSPSPGGRKHTPSPDPMQHSKRKLMSKITLHQVKFFKKSGKD